MPRLGPGQSGARKKLPPRRKRAGSPSKTKSLPAPSVNLRKAAGLFDPGNKKQQKHLSQLAGDEGKRLEAEHQKNLVEAAHNKLSYQREVARQKGQGKKVAQLDKKLSSLQPHVEAAGLTARPIGGFTGRLLGDLSGAALGAPFGLYETGKAGVLDVKGAAHGDVTFPRTREIATAVGKQAVSDVSHPLRHPGYTLLDALAVAGGVAGAGARVGAAGEAARIAARTADSPLVKLSRGAKAAVTRPSGKGGSLAHRPAPGETMLKYKGKDVAQRLHPDAPYLRPFHEMRTQKIQKHLDALAAGATPTGKLARAAEHLVGAPGVVGREIRATGRVVKDLAEERKEIVPKEWIKKESAGQPGPTAEFFRKFNKPFRVFGVYLRPGYIATNLPGNVGMATATQGVVKTAANMARARMSHKFYGKDISEWIEEQSGHGRAESFQPRNPSAKGFGRLPNIEQKLVKGTMRTTDRDFRVASFLYRAREKGYKSRGDLDKLRTDPRLKNELDAISRRTRKDAVDFDSLTPAEKEWVEAVYFYPWQSRGTVWTGRTVMNRPIKSALIAQQSRAAEPEMKRLLGNIPRWMKGYIPTKLGLINPNSLFTPSTPAQVGEQMHQLGRGLANLPSARQNPSIAEEIGTPLVQLAGGESAVNLATSSGPLAMLKRAGVPIPNAPPGKTFPARGLMPSLGPFLLGGLYPRKADMEQVRKQYHRQQIAEASPTQRVGIRTQERIDRIPEELKAIKSIGVTMRPHQVAEYKGDLEALRIQDEFKAAYANKHKSKSYRNLPPANKVAAALAFLSTHSHHPPELIHTLEQQSHALTRDDQLQSYANSLWAMTGIGQYKSSWDSLVRQAKKAKKTPAT